MSKKPSKKAARRKPAPARKARPVADAVETPQAEEAAPPPVLADFVAAPCACCGSAEHATSGHVLRTETRRYVRPPLADPPAFPDLSRHVPVFHTPPDLRGTLVTVSLALVPEAVIRRVQDSTDGSTAYWLAGYADLDDVQQGGEVGAHAWYEVTDAQQEAALSRVAQEA
jgi:hypothetical protein